MKALEDYLLTHDTSCPDKFISFDKPCRCGRNQAYKDFAKLLSDLHKAGEELQHASELLNAQG